MPLLKYITHTQVHPCIFVSKWINIKYYTRSQICKKYFFICKRKERRASSLLRKECVLFYADLHLLCVECSMHTRMQNTICSYYKHKKEMYCMCFRKKYIRIISLYKMQNFLVCKILHCMCTFYNLNNYNCLGIFGWLKYFTKYHQKKSITSVILNNGLKTVRTSVSENCLLQPTKWLFLFYRVFHMIFPKNEWG